MPCCARLCRRPPIARFCSHAKQDAYIHFYVTETGEVLCGSNGQDDVELLTGVNTSGPLWALIDVYGRTVAVEILGAWRGFFAQHLGARYCGLAMSPAS